MNKLLVFIKKEAVFCTAALAALISAVFVPPSAKYIGYINFNVLYMLFALMAVIAGLSRLNVFLRLAEVLLPLSKGKCRRLVFVLWALCFFSAMLVTNDVALITFVPLAITMLTMAKCEEYMIYTIVLQTVAANLGSMMTPMGNPQNLFLYDTFGVSPAEFALITLPYGILSFILLSLATLVLIKDKAASIEIISTDLGSKKLIYCYAVLGILCLLTVFKYIDHRITAGAALVFLAAADRRTLKNIDWFLLLTFVMFFVFVGNLGEITAVKDFISRMIKGRECVSAVILSQVISNVPCAAMLSGFTDNYRALITGTNIGGLGTLVASLASLISYRLYGSVYRDARPKEYLTAFTVINLIFLAVLLAFALLLLRG